MKKMLIASILTLSIFASPVAYGADNAGVLQDFIETLITAGIIPAAQTDRAHEMLDFLISFAGEESELSAGALNADRVEVSVSQFIEHGTRTYAEGDDIEGLILLVKNPTDSDLELSARRDCGVSYTIKNEDDELLYDSGTSDMCMDAATVHYILPAQETIIFPITHHRRDYRLDVGDYTITLTYPGYGTGVRKISIINL